ncbi:hypothetical protein ACFPYI_04780 [Halomarina salina]|uniref:BZIP transcription factor n=1 Tax=Halomarina salina TaxID=1872699 RepID=A0ABD5RJJ1_9EURY|nr:hypothetical protein [Halomarina salina]
MTDTPTTDSSLADRVDALERALTDGSDDATAGDTTLPPTTSVDPDRVETLEADVADLRASVESLRAVVGDIEQRVSETHAAASDAPASDPPVTRATDGDSTANDERFDEAHGPLHAPTGRELSTPVDASAWDTTEESETTDEEEADSGLLARVGDAF